MNPLLNAVVAALLALFAYVCFALALKAKDSFDDYAAGPPDASSKQRVPTQNGRLAWTWLGFVLGAASFVWLWSRVGFGLLPATIHRFPEAGAWPTVAVFGASAFAPLVAFVVAWYVAYRPVFYAKRSYEGATQETAEYRYIQTSVVRYGRQMNRIWSRFDEDNRFWRTVFPWIDTRSAPLMPAGTE